MNQLRLDGSLLSTLLHSVTLPVPSSTCSDQRTWRSPPTASMQHVSGCDAPIHGVSLGCRRRDNATSATSRPRRWVPQQHIVHILDVSEYKCVPIVISCCVEGVVVSCWAKLLRLLLPGFSLFLFSWGICVHTDKN